MASFPDALTVWFDTAQKRVSWDAERALARTYEDDLDRSTTISANGIWCDPLTKTLMLRPMALKDEWTTTTTGIYARFRLAGYTLTAGGTAAFKESQFAVSGDWWTEAESGDLTADADRLVVTTASLAKNEGVLLQWFAFGTGTQAFVQMECGWGGNAHTTADLSLRFYSGGQVEVWWRGRLVKTASIGSSGTTEQSEAAGVDANRFVGVLLIPWRRRELLVWGVSTGQGFTVVLPIAENAGEVVPARPFWWKVPTGKVKVQFAPVRYPSSGTAWSKKVSFASAPPTGAVLLNQQSANVPRTIYSDSWDHAACTVAATMRRYDATGTIFVPDGARREGIVRFELATTDARFTPEVYAAAFEYAKADADRFDETDDADETDLTDWITRLEFDFPEEPDGAEFRLTFKDPTGLATAGGPDLLSHGSRPVQVRAGSLVVFDGVSEPPELTEGFGAANDRLTIRVRDQWKRLERYVFRSPMVLDGFSLRQAFRRILWQVGIGNDPGNDWESETAQDATQTAIDDTDYVMVADGSRLTHVCEAGQTAAECLKDLFETLIPTWTMGFEAVAGGGLPRFFLRAPEGTPTSARAASLATLWTKISDAETALQSAPYSFSAGDAKNRAPRFVVRTRKSGALEPEANEIHVLGWDAREDRPVLTKIVDRDAQDPALARDSRPANWVGEPIVYGLADKIIRDEPTARRAALLLYDRLTPRRIVDEWTCDLILDPNDSWVPVARGSVVTLDTCGSFRIRGYGGRCVRENPDDLVLRDVTYLGDYLGGGTAPAPEVPAWTLYKARRYGFVSLDGGL